MRIVLININNLYNHEKFIKICGEYGVSNDLTNWRNQKYFSTWQSRAWETGKPGMSYINENSFSRWSIEKSGGLTTLGPQKLSETVRDYMYLILTSQTSTRGPIVSHEVRNLGLVYTSSYCRTKPNIVKFGNGTAERHFDLYVEPVSSSTDLIVIYGSNITAKFGGKFARSNRMAPVPEQK